MSNKITLIDLFSGCGGLSLGFQWELLFNKNESNPICMPHYNKPKTSFDIVYANDNNLHALNTYQYNFDKNGKHTSSEDIKNLLKEKKRLPKAQVVIGGPPCQGFSLLNRQRSNDSRRSLWRHFINVAENVKAEVIVMENVQQLLSSPEFMDMKKVLRNSGYRYLMAGNLCAADFGVPQVRHRAIILASKSKPIALPVPTHQPRSKFINSKRKFTADNIMWWTTVRDAIKGLGKPRGIEIREDANDIQRLHFGRTPTQTSLERYKAVPKGGNRFDLQKNRPDITPKCWINKTSGGTDLFGRLWNNKPSVTIRTEFFKPEKGRYLHPTQNRPITYREAARLQSFPDSFHFIGSKIEIAKQIGNAVPPLLSYAIACKVAECLEGKTKENDMKKTLEYYNDILGKKETVCEIGS